MSTAHEETPTLREWAKFDKIEAANHRLLAGAQRKIETAVLGTKNHDWLQTLIDMSEKQAKR